MGQTGFCENLRSPAKSAVSCENLRKSAPPKCYNSQERRKSAKISENLRNTANSARFVPFSLSLLIPLENLNVVLVVGGGRCYGSRPPKPLVEPSKKWHWSRGGGGGPIVGGGGFQKRVWV